MNKIGIVVVVFLGIFLLVTGLLLVIQEESRDLFAACTGDNGILPWITERW